MQNAIQVQRGLLMPPCWKKQVRIVLFSRHKPENLTYNCVFCGTTDRFIRSSLVNKFRPTCCSYWDQQVATETSSNSLNRPNSFKWAFVFLQHHHHRLSLIKPSESLQRSFSACMINFCWQDICLQERLTFLQFLSLTNSNGWFVSPLAGSKGPQVTQPRGADTKRKNLWPHSFIFKRRPAWEAHKGPELTPRCCGGSAAPRILKRRGRGGCREERGGCAEEKREQQSEGKEVCQSSLSIKGTSLELAA